MPCTLLPSPRFVLVTLTALYTLLPYKLFKLHFYPCSALGFSYPAALALSPPAVLDAVGAEGGQEYSHTENAAEFQVHHSTSTHPCQRATGLLP